MTEQHTSKAGETVCVPLWAVDRLLEHGQERDYRVYFTLVTLAQDGVVAQPMPLLRELVGLSSGPLYKALRSLSALGLIDWHKSSFGVPLFRIRDESVADARQICLVSATDLSRLRDESVADRDTSNEGGLYMDSSKEESSKSKKPRASTRPDEFEITDSMRAWAAISAPAVDVEIETQQFLDHHGAKGSKFIDWTAAWRTWMRRAQQFAARQTPRRAARPDSRALLENSAQGWEERQAERERRRAEAMREEGRK